MRFPFLPLAIILLSSSFSVQAKMYKWVDDEGQMHFGDKIPLKYQTKGYDELNERGLMAKHKEAAKTAEEIVEERRLVEESRKAVLAEEKQKKLDRVLLDAYDTERDLIAARDTRLSAVDVQIQLSESNILDSNKKIASIEKQVAKIKASNRKVPKNLYDNLSSEKQRVVMQEKLIASNKKRSQEITDKYNGYIERFRAAKSQ